MTGKYLYKLYVNQFIPKPFKKQDEIQDPQLEIILNKDRPRPTYY